MYVTPNFKTKKQLREAVAAGQTITAYQPGGIFPGATDGWVCVEGPHYPAPHSWYASVLLVDSVVTKVK